MNLIRVAPQGPAQPPRSWDFLKDGAGILPASNMADPLRGANLNPVDLLVREAVQNSLDERRGDNHGPTRIRFDRRVLTGSDKASLVRCLDLPVLAERRKYFRAAHSWFHQGDATLSAIADPDAPLPVLAVSDFNTNGLGGHWNRRRSRQDRFFNLVLSIGGSLKWEDEEDAPHTVRTLGSYGYGKMVFALNSDIRIVAYYSTFAPDPHAKDVRCRAMATAFLPQHTIHDTDYAGQAYYGIESRDPANPRMPLADADAHAWARSLGLPPRSQSESGTTVIVPAARASMQEIIDSCDRWWWPRMQYRDLDNHHNRRVEFEFVDEGKTLHGARPRSRPELSPFLDCAKLLKARKAGERYDIRDVRVGARNSGRLVLKAVDSPPDDAPAPDLLNCIALVRDGLVIRYDSAFAHEDRPPVVGVFEPVSDPDSMQAFVFSEPPTHDDWIANGDRLRGKYAWGRDFIRLTKGRIRNLTRDFQTRQEQVPTVQRTDAADFLRRALRTLFLAPRPAQKRPSPSSRSRRAFTVEIRDSTRRASGQMIEDIVQFRIALSEHAPTDDVPVNLVLALAVLADDIEKPMDALPPRVTLREQVIEGSENHSQTIVPLTLTRSEPIQGEARSPVHAAWKTRWEVSVERR